MKRIILVGFMGTGKTVVGRRLANAIGFRFLDIDSMIEKREGSSIASIFQEKGESYFRNLEKKMVKEVCDLSPSVIATGGGAVQDPENRKILKKDGWMVCLTATPEKILERTKRKKSRPLLQGGDPMETIKKIMIERSEAYADSDFMVDTTEMSVSKVVDTILHVFKRNFPNH